MQTITYVCPNCDTEYVLWDESRGPISLERHNDLSGVVRKQYDEVGTCKFCVRKDPDVPTTAEMDGLLTPKDMRDRFFVMVACANCLQYNKQDTRKPRADCSNCGSDKHALGSSFMASIRTWNPRKKITAADRKKMGV